MDLVRKVEHSQLRLDIPEFKAGDTVKVFVRILEGDKERIQTFEGVVLCRHRGTTNASFTVRKVSDGIGVERIFPLHSPFIERIEVVNEGLVRRSRIFYLRKLKGKASRIKTKKNWNN
jgi:large subunit ribosomal protein L19